MADATANSMTGGCDKALVDYGGNNPLENVDYSAKVIRQMEDVKDYQHSFPSSVDAFGNYAKVSNIVGGDGIQRTKYEIEGWYRGKDGIFEYILEPDGSSNHRFFRPRE